MKAIEDAHGGWALKRAQGYLLERNDRRGLHGDRIVRTCILVSKDGGVDTVREPDIPEVGVRADPVVVDRLVRGELEQHARVSLGRTGTGERGVAVRTTNE